MNNIPSTTLPIDGVLRSYKTESGIELLTRLDRKLEQKPWPTEGWNSQTVYGWIIAHNPRISAVGATLIYWDSVNKKIDGTPIEGIIGNEKTLPSALSGWQEEQLKPFSERLGHVPYHAGNEIPKMIEEDARQLLDKVRKSNVYDTIHRTIEETKSGEVVDPGTLAKGFIAKYEPGSSLDVYNIQDVVDLSTMSFEEVKNAFERNEAQFWKEGNSYRYKTKDREWIITDPHKFVAALSPPHGRCYLMLRDKMGFYAPIVYDFTNADTFDPIYGINEKCRFVPKTGEEFLKCMYEIVLLRDEVHQKESSLYEELNKLLRNTRFKKLKREARKRFSPLDKTLRQLLLSEAIKEGQIVPGLKYAIAEVAPAGIINMSMGEVVDVWNTTEFGRLYPTSKRGMIEISSNLDFEVSNVRISTLDDRGPNMHVPEDPETKLTYKDGIQTLYFLGKLSGRLFEPTISWERESNIISLKRRDFKFGSEIPETKILRARLPTHKNIVDERPNVFAIITESEGPYRETVMKRRVEKPFEGSFELPKVFRVTDENFDLFYRYAIA